MAHPFNLERALAGEALVTREGYEATGFHSKHPPSEIAKLDYPYEANVDHASTRRNAYTPEGRWWSKAADAGDSELDLFMVEPDPVAVAPEGPALPETPEVLDRLAAATIEIMGGLSPLLTKEMAEATRERLRVMFAEVIVHVTETATQFAESRLAESLEASRYETCDREAAEARMKELDDAWARANERVELSLKMHGEERDRADAYARRISNAVAFIGTERPCVDAKFVPTLNRIEDDLTL